jgi:RecA-family ATPase
MISIIDPADWADKPVSPIEWTIDGLIAKHQTALLSGHGGTGKSTIGLHICTAHVLSRLWLTYRCEPGAALFIDAEDDLDTIHRRMVDIVAHYGLTLRDLNGAGLQVLSLVGQDAMFAVAPPNGNTLIETPLYKQILDHVREHKPKQIVISSLANVFGGNEISRVQATRFIAMLNQLAIVAEGSVILIAHPSLAGIASGSGISGSTAWHNCVRTQMHLERPGNGDAANDPGLRTLTIKKNQYAADGDKVGLRWHRGLFLTDSTAMTDYERAHHDQTADQTFLALMRAALSHGDRLCPIEGSPYYAPKKFAKDPAANGGLKIGDFMAAMHRAIDKGTVVIKKDGPPNRRSSYLDFPGGSHA